MKDEKDLQNEVTEEVTEKDVKNESLESEEVSEKETESKEDNSVNLANLIINNEDTYKEEGAQAVVDNAEKAGQKVNKIFQPFKIKDIVFIAIMAACMLVTSAIMPLVIHVPLFGIIQLALGIQSSLFPVIGLMKVRKMGSLTIMSCCFGVFLLFINFIMGIGVMLCAVITELLVMAIFRNYEKDGACVFAGTIFFPLSLPGLYLYYKFLFNGEAGEAVQAMVNPKPGVAVGITIAVVAITFVGSIVGAIIAKELKKAGVLKK